MRYEKIYAGDRHTLTLTVEEAGRPAPAGLVLRLRAPSGRVIDVNERELKRPAVRRWEYSARFDEPGDWEYVWESSAGVLDRGLVRVRATGFS